MRFVAEIKKTDYGVIIKPAWGSDADEVAKLKQNTRYRFEVKQPRNPEFHNKYMALCRLGFSNQEKINNFRHYRKGLLIDAGRYDSIDISVGVVRIPHDISFDGMDQVEFEGVFNDVLGVVAEQLSVAPQDIRDNLENFM